MRETGKLFVVGTPIGNLKDMTFRALEILESVDLIACEDTRVAMKLLNHFSIKKPLMSYHKYNEKERSGFLVASISEGQNIALISDAGMPGISDPGSILIQEAIEASVPIEIIPGPSAGLSGLVVSGLSTEQFYFAGFLPKTKEKDRKTFIEKLKFIEGTLIFYITPHNIKKDLNSLKDLMGNRKAVVIRELTKKFEEIKRGDLLSLEVWCQSKPLKGEMILYVEGAINETASVDLERAFSVYLKLESLGLSSKEALQFVCEWQDVRKNALYNYILLKKEAISDE